MTQQKYLEREEAQRAFDSWLAQWQAQHAAKRASRRAQLAEHLAQGGIVRETLGIWKTDWPTNATGWHWVHSCGRSWEEIAEHLESREYGFGSVLELIFPVENGEIHVGPFRS